MLLIKSMKTTLLFKGQGIDNLLKWKNSIEWKIKLIT